MTVQRFAGVGEAEAAAAALYAFGLDVCLADDEMVGLYWTYSNGLGGIKVMVWWEDLELAGVLLGVISESDVPPDVLATAAEGAGTEIAIESPAANIPDVSAAEGAGIEVAIESLPANILGVPAAEGPDRDVAFDSPLEISDVSTGEEVDADVIHCPACGTAGARRVHRLRMFVVIAALLGGAGLAVGELGLATAAVLAAALIVATVPSHQCPECGERWGADVRRMLEAPEPDTAWPPTGADLAPVPCPRCGADEVHVVDHRRLKAAMLLFPSLTLIVLPLWPFLPKRQCDACGLNRTIAQPANRATLRYAPCALKGTGPGLFYSRSFALQLSSPDGPYTPGTFPPMGRM